MTPVLLLSPRENDRRELEAILRDSSWDLVTMPRGNTPFPVALCDRDEKWQETMKRIITEHRNICVILLSSVADEYLWNEVVQLGGFDVLTRPFRRDRVLSMLDFAYTHWKTQWPAAVKQSRP